MQVSVNSESICKFEYEYLGRSLEELAHRYRYPLDLLQQRAQDSSWVRQFDGPILPTNHSDIETFATELEKLTRARLSIISLHRQIENQPLYAELEKAILVKAIELIQGISILDQKSAQKLSSLAKVLTTVQERNPVNLADQMAEQMSKGQTAVNVHIANVIQ